MDKRLILKKFMGFVLILFFAANLKAQTSEQEFLDPDLQAPKGQTYFASCPCVQGVHRV